MLIPKQSFVLIGEETGTLVVAPNTPNEITDLARNGGYNKGDIQRRVKFARTAALALELLGDTGNNYTAALIPKSQVPKDSKILWEKSVKKPFINNLFNLLLVLGLVTLILSLISWRTKTQPLALFSELYVNLTRGLPVIIVMTIGFMLLPRYPGITISFRIPDLVIGVFSLSLARAAYFAEILRVSSQNANQQNESKKQILGVSFNLAFSRKTLIPLLANEFNSILRNTAILTVVGSIGIHSYARQFASSKLQGVAAYYAEILLLVIIAAISSSLFRLMEITPDSK